MQFSSQQPSGETGHEDVRSENEVEQVSLPLYEFPAESSQLQDTPLSPQVTSQSPGDDTPSQPSEEAILQGLVYPPPPSFYQNMSDVQSSFARPALPPHPGANAPLIFNPARPQEQLYPAGLPTPPFPPAQLPGKQSPLKRSRKWVWIIVSIFAVALLFSGGLCAWAFYQVFNTAFQQESGSINVVNDYFQQIKKQSYMNAYSDLQISGVTQDDFLAKVQASDAQNGSLLSFVVETPTFSSNPASGPDLSQWRITVDVTRTKTSYPVLLTVQKIGGSWKITYIDRF
jgi:hypothetical protein